MTKKQVAKKLRIISKELNSLPLADIDLDYPLFSEVTNELTRAINVIDWATKKISGCYNCENGSLIDHHGPAIKCSRGLNSPNNIACPSWTLPDTKEVG